jgi:hypothetical protein
LLVNLDGHNKQLLVMLILMMLVVISLLLLLSLPLRVYSSLCVCVCVRACVFVSCVFATVGAFILVQKGGGILQADGVRRGCHMSLPARPHLLLLHHGQTPLTSPLLPLSLSLFLSLPHPRCLQENSATSTSLDLRH